MVAQLKEHAERTIHMFTGDNLTFQQSSVQNKEKPPKSAFSLSPPRWMGMKRLLWRDVRQRSRM